MEGPRMAVLMVFVALLANAAAMEETVDMNKYKRELWEGDACSLSDGSPGVCTRLQKCPAEAARIQGGSRPQLCHYHKLESIVCCPNVSDLLAQRVAAKPGDKSKAACQNYYERLVNYTQERNTTLCPVIPIIVGGIAARRNEFVHMAAIGYGDEAAIMWLCGGSLITLNFVLTAGHCLQSQQRGPPRWVRLGDLNLRNSSDDEDAQQYSIVASFLHPDYRPPQHYNDLALLQLDQQVTWTSSVRPACLPQGTTLLRGTATGWGLTGWADAKGSDILMKVSLNVQPVEQCHRAYLNIEGTRRLPNGISNTSMLCVGNLEGGTDTCKGDSGGPLQVSEVSNAYCLLTIVGVTSFGTTVCGARNTPAVYSRVVNFVPWIESVVWPGTSVPS